MHKSEFWDATYEDAMNCIARLPLLAALIYNKNFKNNQKIQSDTSLDWAANFAHLMGYDDPEVHNLMRLYLTIHADHEGGNASAHSVHLTGSTLSDAYFALSSGINALAGPLHGLANQEVVRWIKNMCHELHTENPTREQIGNYIREKLNAGRVIPGYGHAVLRQPDPRFIAQMEFAKKYAAQDPMINIVWNVFDIAPRILSEFKKIRNPWPNVDAHSGALLMHYGINEHNFYTVMFGVSRALGVLSQLCWSRAYGLPLERPKSLSTQVIKNLIGA